MRAEHGFSRKFIQFVLFYLFFLLFARDSAFSSLNESLNVDGVESFRQDRIHGDDGAGKRRSGGSRRRLSGDRIVAEIHAVDRATLENHVVLRQGPGFITENVLDL